MATLKEFAAFTASIAEAVAACEAAQADFLIIQSEIDLRFAQNRMLTDEDREAEACAHQNLADAVATLAQRVTLGTDYRKDGRA